MKKNHHTDVLLVTALKDELDMVLESESDWRYQRDGRGSFYHTRQVKGNKGNDFSVAVAHPTDLHGDFASDAASLLVTELRPRCFSMVGLCAGLRGRLGLGDVVIGERVFRYNTEKLKAFQEGKAEENDVFQNINTYNLSPLWIRKIKNFPSDWINTVKSRRPYRMLSEPENPKIHLAAMGTGNHVGENPELFPMTASHVRKVLAVDAEAVAIGAVAEIGKADLCIIVKSVADHVNDEGNDHLRFYAIETSYRFLMAFLKENLPQSEIVNSKEEAGTLVQQGRVNNKKTLSSNKYAPYPQMGYEGV